MTPVYQIQSEILTYLDEWKDFIWSLNLAENFGENKKYKARGAKFFKEKRAEYASSVECLMSLKHMEHDGYPPDSYGYDFNQVATWIKSGTISEEDGRPLMDKSQWLDDTLGNYLGYRFCALKMFYPPQGYISWHTNWNVPSFNILFTYNPTGDGYWRHINPTGSTSPRPNVGENEENVVTIPDQPGWSCKVGYYGKKEEHEKIVWHTAYSNEPRITLGYVIFDEGVWKNAIEEIAGTDLIWPLAPYDPTVIK
jgi:hypothetical protein